MDSRLRWVLLGGLVGVLTGLAATALAQQAGSGPIIAERVGVDGIPNPTPDIAIGAGGSPGIGGQTNATSGRGWRGSKGVRSCPVRRYTPILAAAGISA